MKPAEATRRSVPKTRAGTGPGRGLEAPAVRQSRASSCPRRSAERRVGSRSSSVTHAAVNPPGPGPGPGPGRREQRAETKHASQSHKAFTVIPPNPNKRLEMQRKAEAELAALEELRLSRAMAYVSISPSSVGGCMSLEEVRSKQQQEMMQAKGKQKPMKTQVTPVPRS